MLGEAPRPALVLMHGCSGLLDGKGRDEWMGCVGRFDVEERSGEIFVKLAPESLFSVLRSVCVMATSDAVFVSVPCPHCAPPPVSSRRDASEYHANTPSMTLPESCRNREYAR